MVLINYNIFKFFSLSELYWKEFSDLFPALLLHGRSRPNNASHSRGLAMPEVQVVSELSTGQSGRQIPFVRRLRRSVPRALSQTSNGIDSEKWLEMQSKQIGKLLEAFSKSHWTCKNEWIKFESSEFYEIFCMLWAFYYLPHFVILHCTINNLLL